MKKEMLINVLQPEECRIAIVEDGILEELYVERTSLESYTGNIYKGKIVNLEPAIQAAFVDFSVGRNGFLHVSDVEPQYYSRHLAADADLGARDRDRGPRPPRDEPRAFRGEDRPPRDEPPARPARDEPRHHRDEPRAPRGDEPRAPRGEDRPARGTLPPERSRDRDRESDWDRLERPERSEKGQRDRSEPRPFGEGLIEADWRVPPTTTRPEASRPEPSRGEREETRRPRPEPTTFARADEPPARPTREPEGPRARAPRVAEPIEPEAPPARVSRPDPIEAELPPSRTSRAPRQAARPAPAPTPEVEPDAPHAPEPEARVAPEPRRARGRGRAARPAPEPIEEPVTFSPPEPEVEPDPGPIDEPEHASEDLPSAPRRRGGRAAIRSRGGDRPPERPREPVREVPAERPRDPLPERPRAERGFGEDLERPRAPEIDRPRAIEPERPRAIEPAARNIEPPPRGVEPPRARTRPPERPRAAEPPERPRAPEPPEEPRGRTAHARAGEPGYVPRRERVRPPEREAPPAFDWSDVPAHADEELDRALDFEPEVEADDEAGAAEKADGPRRRRRRRGRRRDRGDRETGALPADELEEVEEADVEADDDDLEPVAPPAARTRPARDPRPPARPARAPEPATDPEPADDFDFDEDEFDDDAGSAHHEADEPADPDDEIDPELHEEIRREAEEIAELEREMGLRGPVEARPRRGDEPGGRGAPRGRGMVKPPIQDIFRRGDEVLVQVIKESIGTKGPTLSTYISIPGRYLVLMPGLNRVGVSRKIADEGQRRKLRTIMNDLNPPKGLGFIVRTAGLERSKRDLARDLAYLLRLWKVILRRIKAAKTPAPIYQESDMITRTIRDIFNAEIDTIWIDEPQAFERAQEFLRVVMPKFVDRLKFYDAKVPLFHKYGLEEEIVKIQRRRVEMPEGGSIVIDPTEALVAIDVNSGNFRVENDAERTAYEMNLRAAKEIARQLRLRDLGGVICNDFIDMRDERHRRGVERALRDAVARDRARTKILRMSQFGIIEMTRQRIRPSLKRSVYEDCVQCHGSGVVKTPESMSIDVMRLLALASHREEIRRVNLTVCPAVAAFLNNRKRREIARLETEANMSISIRAADDAPAEHLVIECFDAQNVEVRLLPSPPPAPYRRGR